MKTVISLSAAALTLVAGAAEYDWINPSGNTASSAYRFVDEDNWRNAAVPVSKSDTDIWFTNSVGSLRFVDLPDGFSFRKIKGAIGSPVVLLGSSANVYNGFEYSGSGTTPVVYCYADLDVLGSLYVNRATLCGDVASAVGKTVYNAAGENFHRLDLYANAAGENRVDPSFTYNMSLSWGTFHLVAPKSGVSDVTAVWTLVDGSPYAQRPAGTAEHVLCAGTLVSAKGGELPEGTFLKRIFPDGTIELSQNATLEGGVSSDVELTFGAFSPKVTQSLDQINSAANCAHAYSLSKWREEDDMTVKLRYLAIGINSSNPATDKRTLTLTSWTGIPGTIEIVNTTDQRNGIILDNCHLRFGETISEGLTPGFPSAAFVKMNGASSSARVTVVDGTARIANLTGVTGSFVKDGAGTLKAVCSGDIANTGSITVNEGVFAFSAPEGSDTVEIANLIVDSGAEVKLPEGGTLKVTGSFTAADGARITGAGAIDVPGGLDGLGGAVFSDGASVAFTQSNGEPIYEQPAGTAPAGTPAFWVDAKLGVVTASGESSDVLRWNDVRGDGYMFATNVASVYPTLETDAAGRRFIRIARVATASKTDIAATAALVWDVPLSSIRTVFAVVDAYDGGGSWLGSSPRISTHDYWRNAGWASWNQVMGGQCSGKILNGTIYVNGETIPATGVGLPYAGYDFTATNYRKEPVSLPLCLTFMTSGDTEADAFGFCNYEDGCNGQARIYEYVIYTNVLTTAQRLETEEYLMKKWMSAHANYERLAEVQDRLDEFDVEDSPALMVSDGELTAIDVVSGAGTLVKTGGGTLYVEDLVSPETAVDVRAGIFNLRSVKTTAETLPVSPFVHFDASDQSSLAARTVDGVTTVTVMNDVRGEGYPQAVMAKGSSLELNATAGVGGRTMLDFGAMSEGGTMKYELDGAAVNSEKLRTSVSVIGTAHGGGVLVGGANASRSFHDLDGLYRTNVTDNASPMVCSKFNRPRAGMFNSSSPRANRTRLNGVFVNPVTTGFSGGYDLVSLAVYDEFGSSGIGGCHYGAQCDGQEFGEQILFEETLSREQILNVEAYLRRKWFGADERAYRGSRAKALAVSAGAVVNVYGDSPFVVSSLSGAGTVNGAVALAPDGGLSVSVRADGTIEAPQASGFDPRGGGTLRLYGEEKALPLGVDTVVLSGLDVPDGPLAGWTLSTTLKNVSGAAFRTEGGRLVMIAYPYGMHIIVR